MIESKIKCDVCGADVEHPTELKMICPREFKEWTIPCMCEACRDAVDSALELRQRVMCHTVEPYTKIDKTPYRLDKDGNRIPAPQR